MRMFFLLAAISFWYCGLPCQGYGILTKNMIKTPEETRYERVVLLTKEEITDNTSSTTTTKRPTEIPETSTKQEVEDYEGEDEYEGEEEEEEEDDDENNEEIETEDSLKNKETSNVTDATITTLSRRTMQVGPTGRTRLYPVDHLWEKTSPDFWTLLSTAVGCLWNGLGMDCFTYRVVPMVKSMIGYPHYTEFQPFYAASREDGTEVVEGRRRKHLLGLFKIIKGALAGAIGLKTLLLPVLAGLALVAGKSLFISLASIILSGVAAWTGGKFSADRRVQAGPSEPHSQYYMM